MQKIDTHMFRRRKRLNAEETLQRFCSSQHSVGNGWRRVVSAESCGGKSETGGELKRVGQIPHREQRQKNRLNVQRSQAEKLPPPVAEG